MIATHVSGDSLHARYYNPTVGRFLSIDPVRGNPRTPQSWNLYTYVQNNPVNATDPDGRLASWLKWLWGLVTGQNAQKGVNKLIGEATKPKTGKTEEERKADLELLAAADEMASNQGAIDGVGAGGKANQGLTEGIQDLAGPVVREGTSALILAGVGLTGRVASTAFGRSVGSLREFLSTGAGSWQRASAHAEAAVGRAYRGGVSIEEVFVDKATGERIVRHTIVRGNEVLHETFRATAKLGAQ